ncbi:MAG TPA: TIGR03560 family F420-dependent LLM class oxidoreductase [Micromonosporaceae bacterium]|nr:TIGR03560 family F420-dependent LLM class oxidoreductase [Micromonosporaceae bacterium]
MRFSVCVDPGRPWGEVVDLVRHVEAVGWDGVYVCDHFMPYHAGGLAVDGPMLEGWTTLAALAGHTQRLRLGTLVLGNTYRHPAVVANMAATLDHVTGGRFVLGLGAGWQVNEHAAYGLELGSTRSRMDRFEEACAAIRSLLTRPRTTHHGEHYRLTDAPCDPKPVQSRLPILIGGGGERRTLRIAARFADEWHAWGTAEELGHKNQVLDRHCADIGRDPSTIRRVGGATVELSAKAGSGDDRSVAGTPPQVVDVLARYRAAGAQEFIVRDSRTTPLAAATDTLSLFWAEVATCLR